MLLIGAEPLLVERLQIRGESSGGHRECAARVEIARGVDRRADAQHPLWPPIGNVVPRLTLEQRRGAARDDDRHDRATALERDVGRAPLEAMQAAARRARTLGKE